MFDSWSDTVTTTSSPGANWLAMLRARFCKATVVVGANAISSGRAALTNCIIASRPSRNAAAALSEMS